MVKHASHQIQVAPSDLAFRVHPRYKGIQDMCRKVRPPYYGVRYRGIDNFLCSSRLQLQCTWYCCWDWE